MRLSSQLIARPSVSVHRFLVTVGTTADSARRTMCESDQMPTGDAAGAARLLSPHPAAESAPLAIGHNFAASCLVSGILSGDL